MKKNKIFPTIGNILYNVNCCKKYQVAALQLLNHCAICFDK